MPTFHEVCHNVPRRLAKRPFARRFPIIAAVALVGALSVFTACESAPGLPKDGSQEMLADFAVVAAIESEPKAKPVVRAFLLAISNKTPLMEQVEVWDKQYPGHGAKLALAAQYLSQFAPPEWRPRADRLLALLGSK